MIARRTTFRRALKFVQPVGSRNVAAQFVRQARARQYSTAKDSTESTSTSHLPWIIGATVVTAGGIWLSLPASKSSHHPDSAASKTKEKKTLSPEDEKKKKAHEDFQASMKADAPKGTHGGNSVFNHGKAAEANEHKTRKGKFSGREFDNHDTKHSADPGKDFEFIEKKEAEEAEKKK